MRKIKISNGMKTAIVILNEIFALLLIVVLIMTGNYGVNSGSWEDLLNRQSYEQSDYFRTQSVNQVNRSIRAAARASRFEKDGNYAPERYVDISQYAKNGVIAGNSEGDGLYYRLGDLLTWSQNGWSYSIVEIDKEAYLTFHLENMPNEELIREELERYFLTSSSEWNSYYQYYHNVGNQDGQTVQENYKKQILNEAFQPMNYRSIVEYAMESGKDLSSVYAEMDKVLENIVSDLLAYRENINIFSQSSSNVRYFMIDRGNEQIYTNVPENKDASIDEIIEYIRSFGAYCLYDNAELSLNKQNINLSVTDLFGYAEKYGMSGSENYLLAIAIDTNYPAPDILQAGYERYQKLQPVAWLALAAGTIAIIGYLLTLLILSNKAGVDPEKDGLQLNWFDYWKTEIGALVILALAVFGNFMLIILRRYFAFLTHDGIKGIVALAENLIFLTGWLSFIRRAKAKTLWKNSILCKIVEIIYGSFENSRRTTKILALFIGYFIVNVLILQTGAFMYLLLFVFNGIVAALLLREAIQDQKILDGMKKLEEGDLTYRYEVETFDGFRKEFAETLNGVHQVFLNSVKESVKNERMQTDLITNVSHDIKTPLTSIINYVELLKRENIENENAKAYIEVLEQKSLRLKHLTEDLVEASRISSGNIQLEFMQIHMQEMIYQAGGEFTDRFEERNLKLIENLPAEPLYIRADGRRLWRVLENLFNNVAKYAMSNTRVYADLTDTGTEVKFSIKNISEQRLNIEAEDLTQRFIRGDISRSTEGSGLGLSIAKNLTELQGGKFFVYLDGDLFRVTITFPKLEALPEEMSIQTLEEHLEAGLEREMAETEEEFAENIERTED